VEVNLDPRHTLDIARQPILDPAQRVFGYELLYRDSALGDEDHRAEDDAAAGRLLSDAVSGIGLDALTGGLHAFVGIPRRLLVGLEGFVLPPRTTVIELRGDIGDELEVLHACGALRAKGYTLALDGFDNPEARTRLLPYAKYVKVDALATTPAARRALVEQIRPHGLQLIAKNVQTADIAQEVRAAGYGLVQGCFFSRPTTFSTKAVSSRRLIYLRLLAALNRPNISIGDIESLVKHDASMSYRVLRCINSAAFGVRREIHSIRQAIMLLGLDQVRRWASIWALAGVNEGGTHELATVAILRARCCERLAQLLTGADNGAYFLLGLCSLLDTMLSQPMERAIADLPLSGDMRKALLGLPSVSRSMLDAVIAYERGAWSDAQQVFGGTKMNLFMLRDAYADALRWARELARDSIAA
jgi:c-di-GMP-related signal transduction protein